MKRKWTRGEKALFLAPLLFIAGALALGVGPNALRRALGRPQQLATTPTNDLSTIVLAQNGSVLAATGRDDMHGISAASGTIYLWDAHTLRALKSFDPQRWKSARGYREGWIINGLALSPDGKRIGISDRGAPGFAVYEVESQKLLWRTSTRTQSAAFSADGRFVALGEFELRDARSGKIVAQWKAPNGGAIHFFRLSPDKKTAVWIGVAKPRPPATFRKTPMAPNGKSVEIRRLNDGKLLHILERSQETEAVALSPDGRRIVSISTGQMNSGEVDGSSVRCHSNQGKLLWQRDYRSSNPKKIRTDYFCDANYSPDGKTIAVRVEGSNNILLLDAANGHETKRLTATKQQKTNYTLPPALAFSPDGKRLFARGKDAVLVWDLN